MFFISASDIIKKPSYVTQPKEITFVEDAKRHVIKSVILPYDLYEKIREKLEDEIYLVNRAQLRFVSDLHSRNPPSLHAVLYPRATVHKASRIEA